MWTVFPPASMPGCKEIYQQLALLPLCPVHRLELKGLVVTLHQALPNQASSAP
jgi:hypothetical protein